MGDNLEYEELIRYVIKVAQELIPKNDQKYINSTRINKMTILVFNELNKNDINTHRFVWGYYRHGFYSRSVSNFLKYNYTNGFHLEEAKVADVNISNETKNIIENTIINIKEFFLKDRKNFCKWVYGEVTPKEYQKFYFNHKKMEKWFETMHNELTKQKIEINFKEKNHDISSLISAYYFSLAHIEDMEILEIFRRYTDIVELLTLKLKNGANPSKVKIFMDRLSNLYMNRIYSMLPPYLSTINGDETFVEREKEIHLLKIENYKKSINIELNKIYKDIKRNELFPTLEEMKNQISEIKMELPRDAMSLQQIYQDINY